MASADVLYTSDLHGSLPHYRAIFRLAGERAVRAIVLGGDLGPSADPAGQREFLRARLIPLLREHFTRPRSADVYYVFGNGDWRANETVLEEAGLPRLHYLHRRVAPFLDGFQIVGFACVPPTPIRLKDWELWEREQSKDARPDGFRSRPDGTCFPFTFVGREREESLASELAILEADAARVKPLVCVFHGPPRGTACDQILGGGHVGSAAVRGFLERVQPVLALHGHIHESPSVSGRFADRVGATICVNPGQKMEALHAVHFRLDDLEGTLAHTLLGKADLGPAPEPPLSAEV